MLVTSPRPTDFLLQVSGEGKELSFIYFHKVNIANFYFNQGRLISSS